MKRKELSIIETSVVCMIPRGKDKKIPLKEITKSIGIDERSIQSVISRLIMIHGIPICASRGINSDNGFYIPINEKERSEGLRSIKMQTVNMTERIQSVEAANLNTWNEGLIYNYQESLGV
ncbi:hypothetical protein [Vagococcus hydrophili]|uniref:DNA replication protein n=1 Tax=Vagococcus hydrophili TaxID=2714947 RepID=A0A6G8ARD0_9ENTE|nr:hypothetical protein [Vagococcus hydrophili]QIL47556.1 hypothetical protein G7082_02895 [Vagococcus hydrophili]